jgi:hypothetical protein
MDTQIKKAIKNVSINYEDGTHDDLQYYALAGSDKNTWYHVMLSPADNEDKIRLNNHLVELSNTLIRTVNQA